MASVGCEGAMLSPGSIWLKFLKTVAVFQTSSSSLPSMTGGLSKRWRCAGVVFWGVSSDLMRAAFEPGAAAAAAAGCDEPEAAGDAAGCAASSVAGVEAGAGVGEVGAAVGGGGAR